MGSQCDIDKKNVIMVNIEELSEENQRKYTELQEYIKQQFLSGVKKDRLGKVTLNQDFELPAIKLNKEKVEVIPTVSQASSPDLVTQLSAITDRFERAFNDQSSLVASVVTLLEKIEGKRVINISNDGVPQVDSQGVLHSTTSAALEASPEAPLYGMPTGFYPGQTPLPKRTRLDRPQAGLTALSGQMVMVPDQSLPLSVVPSTLV
jgi:DNA-binding protein YbaB